MFPYVALHPSTGKKAEYRSLRDVYDEIIRLYDKAEKEGFNVGEALYKQSFFFVDHALLVDESCQDKIKEYIFCKTFSCPPKPSLQEVDPVMMDEFLIIEEEYTFCREKIRKESINA